MGTSVSRHSLLNILCGGGGSNKSVTSVESVSSAELEVHNMQNAIITTATSMMTNTLLGDANTMRKSSVAAIQIAKNPSHLYGQPIEEIVLQEYNVIPIVKKNTNFATALSRENVTRNRCPDILPYEDHTIRVNPTKQNPFGYINASPLVTRIGGRDWKYIVGQIPQAGDAINVFWQMVWEQSIKIVAVLERDSSALFYPEGGYTISLTDFQLVVESKTERSETAAGIAQQFNLVYGSKKKQRKVWLLPYEDEWKDEVPARADHFLSFLEEVNSIQRKINDMSPLLVLCGTGAGRSGVLILSDLLLHAADSGQKLRCDTLLHELRVQRMAIVSTSSQYAFVLYILAKYFETSRLI